MPMNHRSTTEDVSHNSGYNVKKFICKINFKIFTFLCNNEKNLMKEGNISFDMCQPMFWLIAYVDLFWSLDLEPQRLQTKWMNETKWMNKRMKFNDLMIGFSSASKPNANLKWLASNFLVVLNLQLIDSKKFECFPLYFFSLFFNLKILIFLRNLPLWPNIGLYFSPDSEMEWVHVCVWEQLRALLKLKCPENCWFLV